MAHDKNLLKNARRLRRQQTPAESRLWAQLRGSRRKGYKFRRQHIIDYYIVDFYCREAQLVIEVDGETHKYTEEQDAIRQTYLEELGLRVMRFTNEDVMDRLEGVIVLIDEVLGD